MLQRTHRHRAPRDLSEPRVPQAGDRAHRADRCLALASIQGWNRFGVGFQVARPD